MRMGEYISSSDSECVSFKNSLCKRKTFRLKIAEGFWIKKIWLHFLVICFLPYKASERSAHKNGFLNKKRSYGRKFTRRRCVSACAEEQGRQIKCSWVCAPSFSKNRLKSWLFGLQIGHKKNQNSLALYSYELIPGHQCAFLNSSNVPWCCEKKCWRKLKNHIVLAKWSQISWNLQKNGVKFPVYDVKMWNVCKLCHICMTSNTWNLMCLQNLTSFSSNLPLSCEDIALCFLDFFYGPKGTISNGLSSRHHFKNRFTFYGYELKKPCALTSKRHPFDCLSHNSISGWGLRCKGIEKKRKGRRKNFKSMYWKIVVF